MGLGHKPKVHCVALDELGEIQHQVIPCSWEPRESGTWEWWDKELLQ